MFHFWYVIFLVSLTAIGAFSATFTLSGSLFGAFLVSTTVLSGLASICLMAVATARRFRG